MKISILSVVTDIYKPFLSSSLLKKAQERGLLEVDLDAFFSFAAPKERIDAPIYGPGAGMLIRPEIVQRAVEAKQKEHGQAYKVFFSPQGTMLDQQVVKKIADEALRRGHLMLLPARYEGMDARVEEYYADEIVSVGNFVLMGGDLAAMMLLEAVARYIPEVVGKQESVLEESFTDAFVEYPHYTQPVSWKGMEVPEILRSGNHAAIDKWRMDEAAKRTVFGHFEWLRSRQTDESQRALAEAYIPHHYCALLHEGVLIGPEKKKGTTSVTSLDLHDIARSARTYGLKDYFVVTPLEDQQKIVRRLLEFWRTDGKEYNRERYEAVRFVDVVDHLEDVIATIEKREGVRPLVVATSARVAQSSHLISYYDQKKVWASRRPVLLIFGTGKGLQEEVLRKADFLLKPVEGFSNFNHLSVRSAAAIVFDRWLGINEKDC